ncbi:hypothetical protein N0V82_006667 [Gnomoniopsis sp. IMI 355080]|nr:hypothetical protein N0V82_006667 [Gnomoniopsis sp. IMI 355080]
MYRAITAALIAVVSLSGTGLAAGPFGASAVEVLDVRRASVPWNDHILRDIRDSRLVTAVLGRASPDIYKTNASLDLSWSNAELFNYGMLSVSCVTCYVKGQAHATLSVSPDFNISSALKVFAQEFVTEIDNITDTVWNTFKNWTEVVVHNTSEAIGYDVEACTIKITSGHCNGEDLKEVDWDALAFPTIPIDFDLDLQDIPDATINLKFDEFELYFELDMALDASSTYTISLYPKDWSQPAGFEVAGQMVGIVISLDLILSLDAEVDISSGVHVKFDDGLSLELALFGSNVSSINLSPGTFEFLPVTVSTTGLILDATLRLGVTSGLEMNTTGFADAFNVGAGATATAFADIAHFRTNITPSDTSVELKARDDTSYSSDCTLPIVESYEFGLGAQAGAYVAVLNNTWGPMPSTSVQIFYTTLYSACAISAAATASGGANSTETTAIEAKRTEPPLLEGRDDASSTMGTATTEYTLTNVVCKTSSLSPCPPSAQTTSQTTKTSIYTSMVASGVDLTFPATTDTSVSLKSFGTGVRSVSASSGSPSSYVPPKSATSTDSVASSISSAINNAEDGYSGLSESNKKLVIGLSVGLGGALLIGLAVLATFCVKRRRGNRGQRSGGLLGGEKSGNDDSRPFLTLTHSSQRPKWDSGSSLGTPRIHERALLFDEPTAYVSPRRLGEAA